MKMRKERQTPTKELHLKHRPTELDEVVGQEQACEQLLPLILDKCVPHSLLFTGPSGCGKTTLARIMRRKLGCKPLDYKEINTADFRGIDEIRTIRQQMSLAPLAGSVRVYLIDECHKLTDDAQNAILKMLEEPPDHVYFMLATTHPQKLLKTIRTRCTEIQCFDVAEDELEKLVKRVATIEKRGLDPDVITKIAKAAMGSPRKALVILQQVLAHKDKREQVKAIVQADVERTSIEICRLLCNTRTTWKEMAECLRQVAAIETDYEDIRLGVMGYCAAILLKGAEHGRAYKVMFEFQEPFFNNKKAGLVMACYSVVKSK